VQHQSQAVQKNQIQLLEEFQQLSLLPTPPPVADQYPPQGVTELGLKIGKCQKSSDMRVWSFDSFATSNQNQLNNMAPCGSDFVENGACSDSQQSTYCKVGSKAFRCNYHATWACYGWAYEKVADNNYVPLVGASAYIFHFAGCIVGACDPQSQVVKTDSNGFYLITTKTILDSIRIKKDGYVGNGGGCFDYTGMTLGFTENAQPVYPGQMMLKSKTSCK